MNDDKHLELMLAMFQEDFPVSFKLGGGLNCFGEVMDACNAKFGPMADWKPFGEGRYANPDALWDVYINDAHSIVYLFFKEPTDDVMEMKLRYG